MREALINKLTTILNNNMGNRVTEELAYGVLFTMDALLKELEQAIPVTQEDIQQVD